MTPSEGGRPCRSTDRGSGGGAGGGGAASPTTTEGDLIVRGASADQRLAIGSTAQVLTVDTTLSGKVKWATPTGAGGSGGFELAGEYTVTGSAATTMPVSGLDLDAHGQYFVDLNLDNATASGSAISLYYNADTTATNYDMQELGSDSSTTTSFRQNTGRICGLTASGDTLQSGYIRRDVDGNVRSQWQSQRDDTTAINLSAIAHRWRTASTNVTSLVVSSSVASAFSVGCYVKVYRRTVSGAAATDDGARMTHTGTAQSVTGSVSTTVDFNVIERDDGGYADLTTNRFTIPAGRAGWYAIGGMVEWAGAANHYLEIHKNGTRYFYEVDTGSGESQSSNNIAYLNAGDYITLVVFTTGGTQNLVGAGSIHPQFWIHRLSGSAGAAGNNGAAMSRNTDLSLSARHTRTSHSLRRTATTITTSI